MSLWMPWWNAIWRLRPAFSRLRKPLRINGRCIVVGDGIKVPKRGRKMPAVKLLHQQSESNPRASARARGWLRRAVRCAR